MIGCTNRRGTAIRAPVIYTTRDSPRRCLSDSCSWRYWLNRSGLSDTRSGGITSGRNRRVKSRMSIGFDHGALAGDMASLPTLVAYLAGGVQGASIRRGAVARNMSL